MLSEMFLFGMLPEEAHALPLTGGQYKLEPAMEAMETETPRTDAIKYVQSDPGNGTGVYTFQGHYSAAITLCSQLERELTAAHEKIAGLRDLAAEAIGELPCTEAIPRSGRCIHCTLRRALQERKKI